MKFFIVTNSFAAPFFSDRDEWYQEAETAREAIEAVRARYKHPCGLYSATAWESHEDFHVGKPSVAQWLCNVELAKQRETQGKGSYSIRGHGLGRFEVDEKMVEVEDPQGGAFVERAGAAGGGK